MRLSVVFSATAVLGLSAVTALGDSVGPPEPVEVAPVVVSASGADSAPIPVKTQEKVVPVAPVAAPAATPATAPVVTLPVATIRPGEGETSARTQPNSPYSAPIVVEPRTVTTQPVPGRLSRQSISAYYVNRVSVQLPAGIKVITRKDWYANEIVVSYTANPYTNWRGITPEALAFRHTGTTMEIIPSGTKYVPAEITVTVPSAVEVIVR